MVPPAQGTAAGGGRPPPRVCSLLPSATEIVGALGLGDALVAVSGAEGARAPRGGGRAANLPPARPRSLPGLPRVRRVPGAPAPGRPHPLDALAARPGGP